MDGFQAQHALDRLRQAADRALNGFPDVEWRRVSGPGPDTIRHDGAGGLHGLTFEPGQEVVLETDMTVPASAMGVQLEGDALEGILFALYPIQIVANGVQVFEDAMPPAAAGPSSFVIVPAIQAGANGLVEMRVNVPDNQTTPWFNLRLTTPGLRARFEALDVAWASLSLAQDVASTPSDRAIVETAAACIPDPLPEDGPALETALASMASALMPLAGRIKANRVHLVGHSHIDMNWLWTWSDTVEVIKRDIRSVLQLMDEFPELTFSHSQPATYEVIRLEEPALFDRILARIAEGRWEPITLQWVEGDVNMASGEATARQLLEAVHYTRDVLGFEPSTFHAPDTFGHAGNLPQLVQSAGGKRYYHHRANPGRYNQWPAYWWEGQDGSRVLGISTQSYNGEIHARDLVQVVRAAAKNNHACALHFHGIGDHGGGPSRQNLQALRRFTVNPLLPTAFCSTLEAYSAELLGDNPSLPNHQGESSTIFEGCYTTHADTKRMNREGENLLCTADTLATLADVSTDSLTDAWRTVLFNQFHDIFDGSAIHEVYAKQADDYNAVTEAAGHVTGKAMAVLAAGADKGSVVVANPLAFEREDWVEFECDRTDDVVRVIDRSGRSSLAQKVASGRYGFVARVPSLGVQCYRVEPASDWSSMAALPAFGVTDIRSADAPEAGQAPYLHVDTGLYSVKIRRDCGIIVSLVDKRVGRDLVAWGMRRASDYMDTARPDLALGVLQVVDEYPHAMTAWQIQEVHTEESLIRGAETTVVEAGPVRLVLEVKHTVRKSTITQRIVLYADLPRIEFQADLDWQEIGNGEVGVPNLKAAFTARLLDAEAWFETPFAAVRRPADGQESPALRWVDVGGPHYGMAVLNDSKYGYDVLGSRIRLSLVRSAYDPDSISDTGQHSVRYALLPHRGDWREAGVVAAGLAFNQPLVASVATGEALGGGGWHPHVTTSGGVHVGTVKAAKCGSGTVIRVYEAHGKPGEARVTGIPNGAVVCEVNVVEDIQATLPVADGGVSLSLAPWQVRTFLVK